MMQLLLLVTLVISVPTFGQTAKHQDVQKLLTVLETKRSTEDMIDKVIDIYKKQKPIVPQQVWTEIKNSVDYNLYLNKVAEIFSTNYVSQELKQLITLAIAAKPKEPKFKDVVQQQLYDAGEQFGKQFISSTQKKLKSKGY